MPTYDYKCKACEHEFTDFLSISNRKQPESQPCPNCGKSGEVIQTVCKEYQKMGNSMRMGLKPVPTGFRDVLTKIKQNHPKNTMNR